MELRYLLPSVCTNGFVAQKQHRIPCKITTFQKNILHPDCLPIEPAPLTRLGLIDPILGLLIDPRRFPILFYEILDEILFWTKFRPKGWGNVLGLLNPRRERRWLYGQTVQDEGWFFEKWWSYLVFRKWATKQVGTDWDSDWDADMRIDDLRGGCAFFREGRLCLWAIFGNTSISWKYLG